MNSSRFRIVRATAIQAAASDRPDARRQWFISDEHRGRLTIGIVQGPMGLVHAGEDLRFGGVGRPGESDPEDVTDPLRAVATALPDGAEPECPRTLSQCRVVQHRQGLERGVGLVAARAGGARVRRVKILEHRVGERPLDVHVHAPAVSLGAPARGHQPFALELGPIDQRGRQWRLHARAADLRVHQPARGQAKVADHFGLDPEPVLPRQQAVARIALVEVGSGVATIAGRSPT